MNNKIKLSQLPKSIKTLFLVPTLFCALLINPAIEGDSWFILNYGRYIVTNHSFPTEDLFTMHNGLHTIVQQWLTDVVYWLIYSKIGAIGVIAFLILLFILAAFLTYNLCKTVSGNHFVASIVTFFIMLFTTAGSFCTRPQVITIVILLAEINILELNMKNKKAKILLFIPFLSLLQINFHCSMWPIMFILMLPYLVDCLHIDFKLIKCSNTKMLPLIITFFVSFVVGLINPYGFEAMTYLFRSYNLKDISSYVQEMLPLNVSTASGFVGAFAMLFAVVLCAAKAAKTKNSVPLRYFLLILGFGFMMFVSGRNSMFFWPLSFFAVAYCFKNFDPQLKIDDAHNPKTTKAVNFIAVLIIVLSLGAGSFMAYSMSGEIMAKAQGVSSTKGAVNYILKNYKNPYKINIYTSYDDGSYPEYMGLKCFMDARAEVFFKSNNEKEDIFEDYYSVQQGNMDYRHLISKYNFTLFIVSNNDALGVYLPKDKNYRLIYKDKERSVFESIYRAQNDE